MKYEYQDIQNQRILLFLLILFQDHIINYENEVYRFKF